MISLRSALLRTGSSLSKRLGEKTLPSSFSISPTLSQLILTNHARMSSFCKPFDKSISHIFQKEHHRESFAVVDFIIVCSLLAPLGVEKKEDNWSFPLPKMYSKEWFRYFITKYPETLWLVGNSYPFKDESQNDKLQNIEENFSEHLFKRKVSEFDQLITKIHALHLFVDGSEEAYAILTQAQPEQQKLSIDSFRNIHLQTKHLLRSNHMSLSSTEIFSVMTLSLVLRHAIFSPIGRERFGLEKFDEGSLYFEAMELLELKPNLSPSFEVLESFAKKLLIKLALFHNFDEILHLEGGVGMFSSIKAASAKTDVFTLLAFCQILYACEIAGNSGNLRKESSFIQPVYRSTKAMEQAVGVLNHPFGNEWTCYSSYLEWRMNCLGFDPEVNSDRILGRLGAMFELSNSVDGETLKNAISELDREIYKKLLIQFDIFKQQRKGKTPIHLSKLLIVLLNHPNLGKTRQERMSNAVKIGLAFVVKVNDKFQQMLKDKHIDLSIPLNFSNMVTLAQKSPEILQQEFQIDVNGVVQLKS